MPKLRDRSNIEARIYTRTRAVGAAPRHQADFRDFADVGGGLEKLAPDGANHATTCADEAQALAQSRLAELVARRADAAARAAIPASIAGRPRTNNRGHGKQSAQKDARPSCHGLWIRIAQNMHVSPVLG